MSVDVFGRQLGKSKTRVGLYARGPAGDGFKLTHEGQYDMNYKRLCNIADAIKPNDAISMKIMKSNLDEVLHTIHTNLNILKNHIDRQGVIIESLNSQIQKISTEFEDAVEKVQYQAVNTMKP